jgi:hypothetical protein
LCGERAEVPVQPIKEASAAKNIIFLKKHGMFDLLKKRNTLASSP